MEPLRTSSVCSQVRSGLSFYKTEACGMEFLSIFMSSPSHWVTQLCCVCLDFDEWIWWIQEESFFFCCCCFLIKLTTWDLLVWYQSIRRKLTSVWEPDPPGCFCFMSGFHCFQNSALIVTEYLGNWCSFTYVNHTLLQTKYSGKILPCCFMLEVGFLMHNERRAGF